MRGVAALALLLANVHLGRPCEKVEKVLVCLKIPSYFDPGCSSLLMLLKNVGEVNSSVFHSDSLASIDSLTINNANITRIAESGFGSFPHLATVTLTGNMLSQVNADWFGNPAVLRELNVADNRIEGVTEFALNGLTNLTKLKLNKNRIQTIHPSSFRSQSALAEVDLSENRLTWVPPQIFTSLGSLGSIRLDGNPWNCSCAHKDFVASVKGL
ncbi:uncharacterized protein LOC142382718 [Odontesthes bonariensis]|uniref:uncharacterized protein LOC142382718 n=1 Tax=Odontesthes bonariensis TaxID=219752 RepID=UPI003F58CC8C